MKDVNKGFLISNSEYLSRVLDKKTKVDAARPLPQMAIDRLREDLALEWTYNSNGLEGNTLTLAETRVVLEDGITIGGKTMREHFEIINHHKAIEYVESIVKPDFEFRGIDLLNLHSLVLKNIQDDWAGRIRTGTVRIVGANFTSPNPQLVSELLDELIEYINSNPQNLDPICLATVFHHQLVWIHPFFDGNGRTVRLAMNLLLQKYGFPPAIILKNDRKKYFNALNAANNGDYKALNLLVIQAVERSLNIYINIIPGEYFNYQPISSLVTEPEIEYGMEYVSLLARTGKINAHKEGRNWVTTKEEILNYQIKKSTSKN